MNRRVLRTVLAAEARRYSSDPVILRVLLLSPAAILVSFWPYTGSPFVPALLMTFAALEPRFNNILFRTPREFEAMLVLPTDWKSVIAAKNLVSIAASLITAIAASAVVGYFSPLPMGPSAWGDAGLYFASVIFPLLMAGNLHSVQHPRRMAGFAPDDLADGILMVLGAGVSSIPFLVFRDLGEGSLILTFYSLSMAGIWWLLSIPRASAAVVRERSRICRTG